MFKFFMTFIFVLQFQALAKVSESDYLQITNTIKESFQDEFASQSKSLSFNLKGTENDKPNAFAAKRDNDLWEVTVMRSLLNIDVLSPSSLALILCHEVGHFLGGKPYVVGRKLTAAVTARAPKKMSAEGQADLFAAKTCFPIITNKLPELIESIEINPIVKSISHSCEDQNCLSLLSLAYETTVVYQKLMAELDAHEAFFAHLNNPATDRTLNYVGEYPTLDCRFETFVTGFSLSSEDETKPTCWFLD